MTGCTMRRHDAALDDEAGRLAALQRYDVLDTDPEPAFDRITSIVQTVLEVPMVAVSLMDRHRQWFKSHRGLGVDSSARELSFCTHTILGREPMIVADARRDVRFRDNPLVTGEPNVGSYIGVPMATPDGYNVGALCAIDRVPRQFTAMQVDVMTKFGALVIDELELRQIAKRDHLTGALTRRAFVAQAEKEIARRDRYQRPSALVLFDIDHFKTVNDSFGHAAGDEALRMITQCCSRSIRANDMFGRVGGEEFAVVLPETDAVDAMISAERIRMAIATMAIDLGFPLHLTASFGIAPLAPWIRSVDEWLAEADLALYAAKNSGRNRCRRADLPAPAY
ncbi:MAG: diguanylate cyclase [Janthinobacterium lividum]